MKRCEWGIGWGLLGWAWLVVGCLDIAFAQAADFEPPITIFLAPLPTRQAEPVVATEPVQVAALKFSIFLAPDESLDTGGAAGFEKGSTHAVAVALIETGKSQKAYELLAPMESQFSQDADYNYLLGLAGVESGRASEAVFSLQRTAAMKPEFAGAKMDLARAYFLAGDNIEARKAFTELRALNPPIEVARVIDRYVELIEAKELDARPHFGAGVEIEGGYDSNANSGTRNETFGGFVLDPQTREQGSPYAGAGVIGSYRAPLSSQLRWSNALRLGYRYYPDAVFVASAGLLGSSDLLWRRGGANYSAGVVAGQQWLDGDANQTLYGVNLGAGFPVGFSTRLGSSIRVGEARFDALNGLKLRQYSGNLAWQWRPNGHAFSALDIGPIAGREVADRNSAPFTRTLYGVQMAADWRLLDYDWHGAAGYLLSDYVTVPFFGHREDKQLSLRVSMDGPVLFGSWQVEPRLSVVDNQSSLALYDYRRFDLGIAVQRSVR